MPKLTNYIKVKINNSHQDTKSKLCGDKYEIVNHISKYGNQAQKEYKTRHNRVKKLIHWELCKRLKLDHTTKWYMCKPKSVLKYKVYKILLDFETQKELIISSKRLDIVLINKSKRTCCPVDFAILMDHRLKIKKVEW